MLSEKVIKALEVANEAHSEQLRKGTNIPYIIHPIGVFDIALRYTADEDVLAACLLHDTVEDVPEKCSESRIREVFGDRVADIVMGVSEDKEIKDWKRRKELYFKGLANGSKESAIVSMADKINNLSDIIRDYDEIGDKVWDKFAVPKDEELWYYDAVYKIMQNRNDIPKNMVNELGRLVQKMREIV